MNPLRDKKNGGMFIPAWGEGAAPVTGARLVQKASKSEYFLLQWLSWTESKS